MHHHEEGREDEIHKFYIHVAATTKIGQLTSESYKVNGNGVSQGATAVVIVND